MSRTFSISLLNSGIGRSLFIWFMVLALIPLGGLGWFAANNSRESLEYMEKVFRQDRLYLQANYITEFFDEKLRHLNFQAFLPENLEYIEVMQVARTKSGKGLVDFISGFAWSQLATQYGNQLKEFQTSYGYSNIFLLDGSGEVFFSTRSSGLLGKNILTEPLRETNLGKAILRAEASNQPTTADLEQNRLYGEGDTLFLVRTIIGNDGSTKGVVVLQLSLEPLFEFLANRSITAGTRESYLVGTDRLMRSWSRLEKGAAIGRQTVDTLLIRQWLNETGNNKIHEEIESLGIAPHGPDDSYRGYGNTEVLGQYTHLPILTRLGIEWILVTEVSAAEVLDTSTHLRNDVLIVLVLVALMVIFAAGFISWRLVSPLIRLTQWADTIRSGNFDKKVIASADNEVRTLIEAFSNLVDTMRENKTQEEKENWLKQSVSQLNERLRGERDMVELGNGLLSFMADTLGASVGVFYVAAEGDILRRVAGYAHEERKSLGVVIAKGEGITGQVLVEKKPIILHQLPEDYILVQSGLGSSPPRILMAYPCIFNDRIEAVIELGSFTPFTPLHLQFLNLSAEGIAIATAACTSRLVLQQMLSKSREQSDSLEQQGVALNESNQKLQRQAETLKASELRLQQQREELRVSNEELEAQAQQLEEQKEEANRKNEQLQMAQLDLEKKAEEVARASKYKSEFLANMSHELRTPLNSLLILSKSLAENEDGNLSESEVKDAEIIHNSASDLLGLINQILDLAKIEAGRMEIFPEHMSIKEMVAGLEQQFRPVAKKSGLEFTLEVMDQTAESIFTDREKVGRIIKNLLANALKFTSKGGVTLRIAPPHPSSVPKGGGRFRDGTVVIEVQDTGVGIPPNKHKIIFEAFQQADGSTSRQFGGTGLGLSISSQLARLLGAEIQLESMLGQGSVFTLFLPPLQQEGKVTDAPPKRIPEVFKPIEQPDSFVPSAQSAQSIVDDRDEIAKGDRVMLVIEDDSNFARIIINMARKKGFKCLRAEDGETGLILASQYLPSSIILDLGLPGMDGWGVLDSLKTNIETRHIPVHIMSAMDDTLEGLKKGAVGYCTKPVSKSHIEEAFAKMAHFAGGGVRKLLLVEDDSDSRHATFKLLDGKDIEITQVGTGSEALKLLAEKSFDCMILDLGLPDMSGFDFLDRVKEDTSRPPPPVIVYSGQDLSRPEYDRLKAYTDSFVVKGVESSERLLNEVILFLHRVERDLPDEQRIMIRKLHDQEDVLSGKTVLIVDDDVSNLYALVRQLERKEMKTVMATDGSKALATLEKNQAIDLVLMDIMMPVMDGYETMKQIRQQHKLKELPIIALTAKAMSDDKRKCLDAGASDYLTKPVDMQKLFSMMRVWLHK